MTRPNVLVDTDDLSDPGRAPLLEELQARDLLPEVTDISKLAPADLVGVRAVVFVRSPKSVGRGRDRLQLCGGNILDVGASIVVLADADDAAQYRRISGDKDLNLPRPSEDFAGARRPEFNVFSSSRLVANHVLSLHAQPVAGPIAPSSFGAVDALLLRRAFSDATSLSVSTLAPGRTSQVWRVDACSKGGAMRPFLAKFTDRNAAEREFRSYRDHVHDFIPFSFRPSLVFERCAFGSGRAVLVAQFIEGERSLSEIILQQVSPAILHSVFENLLSGWWRHGVSIRENAPVLKKIRHWYHLNKTGREERLAAVTAHATAGGATASVVQEVLTKLDSLPPITHTESVIHGDLHGSNVRVRGNDVYLIDYGSTGYGPIVADPAMLEANLVIDAGIVCHGTGSFEEWRRFVSTHLFGSPHRTILYRELSDDVTCLDRLGEAIRTIRLHALAIQANSQEYEQALLAAYVRMCSYRDEVETARNAVLPVLFNLTAAAVARL